MTSTRRIATVLGAALLTVGCTSESPTNDTSKATPTAREETAAELPGGMQWVDSATGLRFAVPKRSTIITGPAVDDPRNNAAIEAYVDSTAGSIGTIRAYLRRTDLLVVDKRGTTIYVADREDAVVPSEEELKESIGDEAGVTKIDTIVTPLGDATIFYVGVRSGRTVYFRAYLYFGLVRGNVTVEITTRDYDEASYLVSQILPTLGDLGDE